MEFCEKLNILMQIYRMNNVTLARGTGVDASLVSRWRSGSRVPSARSSTAADIGAFLSGAAIMPLDQTLLYQTLGRTPQGRDELARLLTEWLRSDHIIRVRAPSAEPVPAEGQTRYLGAAGIVGQMARLLDAKVPEDTGPVNLWPQVQRGNPGEHEIFSGENGKRKAVISFLHKLQSSPRALDVFIMIGATSNWITGDEAFAELWSKSLLNLLQRGNRIHIVIPEGELGDALRGWLVLPLFHSPQCRVYAIGSRPVDTMMVAQGYGAVLSYGVGPKAEVTLLFGGIVDSALFETVFHLWLREGYPVLFTCPDPVNFSERLLLMEQRDGAYYQARNSLCLLHLEPEDFEELLGGLHVPDRSERVAAFTRRCEAMERSLSGCDWLEVVPRACLTDALRMGVMTLDGSEAGLTQPLTVSGTMLTQLLERLALRLRQNPRLHILWLDSEPLPIQILYKAGAGAYFTLVGKHAPSPGHPSAAFTAQPQGMRDLEQWFTSLSYDRDEALRFLMNAL